MTHPVTAYAEAVVAGDVPASKVHRASCARHLLDLARGGERGLNFDEKAANRAISFFPTFLRHVKGEWSGDPIDLPPWGVFVVGSLFGWKREDGLRRFRTGYVEVPRKNAKTTILSGISLLATFFDGEGGAEGYFAATTRDQANLGFKIAQKMVRKSSDLTKRITPYAHYIQSSITDSELKPLSADAHTLDGLNPHCVVIDELHAHPNSDVVDVMATGTGARSEPLLVEITTAGQDRESICWKHHEYSIRVNDPNDDHENDSWFSFITGIDEGDDWRDPASWAKANPSLGISVKLDDLEAKCKQAQAMPTQEAAFRQKHLNEWCQVEGRALDMDAWDARSEEWDESVLEGRQCFGGLDLAKVHDLSAFVLVWPPRTSEGDWYVRSWFWIPDEDIKQRSTRDRVPYDVWARDGLVTATPGNVTDFDFIEHRILEEVAKYQPEQIGYDRLFASQLVTHLMDQGVEMVPVGMGYASMAAPTEEFIRLVTSRRFCHGGNPVLRWNASNLVVTTGPAGPMKPDKKRSRERIDGVVACIVAMARAIVREVEAESVYEKRGVLTF